MLACAQIAPNGRRRIAATSRPKPATRRRSEREALTDEVNQHPAAVKAGGSGKENDMKNYTVYNGSAGAVMSSEWEILEQWGGKFTPEEILELSLIHI